MDGQPQLVYDKNVKLEEAITEFLEDEVLYAGHAEPEEIPIDYVVRKCTVEMVKNSERSEKMNGVVTDGLPTYYAPIHLAYDYNRSLVLRVQVNL